MPAIFFFAAEHLYGVLVTSNFEYKKIEPGCREGVRAQLERMKELCKERNNLYEKQNDFERTEMEN